MKTKIFVLMVASFFTLSLYAQNSNDALRLSEPGILASARSLGMGNSIGSAGNDFSSALFNPAGLGLFNNSEISISGFNNNFNNNTLFYGNPLENSINSTGISQISMVYKLPVSRGSLVFALGYSRTKDFNRIVQFNGYNSENNSMIQDLTGKRSDFAFEAGVSYPINDNLDATLINGKLQQSGKTTDEGGMDNWSFAAATEIQKDLFIGGTLNIISGSFDRRRQYFETDPYHLYTAIKLDPADDKTLGFKKFSYFDSISWDISGWDMQLGFIYKIKDRATIGASIRFPKKITIKENYRLSSTGEFATTTFESNGAGSSYEYKISTPWEFSFGGSFVVKRLLVAADFKYIDYTQMQFTEGLTFAERDDINFGIKDDYRGVFNYNFGAEYSLYELGIKLRGGFMVMKSAFNGDTAEYDKKFVTGGIGIPVDQMQFDLGMAYGWWKDFGYNYQSATQPVYHDLKSTTITASIKYNF